MNFSAKCPYHYEWKERKPRRIEYHSKCVLEVEHEFFKCRGLLRYDWLNDMYVCPLKKSESWQLDELIVLFNNRPSLEEVLEEKK